jgi:hypothetical protein
MEDIELMERAARAAGFSGAKQSTFGGFGDWMAQDEAGDWTAWNPLSDDGDAMRLAVKLEFDIGHMLTPGMVTVTGVDDSGGCVAADEPYRTDAYAATRRAIVRAAAALVFAAA